MMDRCPECHSELEFDGYGESKPVVSKDGRHGTLIEWIYWCPQCQDEVIIEKVAWKKEKKA